MADKPYRYYTSKTFEEQDDNAQTLTRLRADQEADRILGMRPDLARSQYCILLAKVLAEKATRLAKSLSKKEPVQHQEAVKPGSIWDDA